MHNPGDDCLIGEEPRIWYNCTKGDVTITQERPGSKATDPENIPYWLYTHFGLNILWLVTILLFLTPSSGSENKGKAITGT